MNHSCPLCSSKTALFYKSEKHAFGICENCKLLSRPESNLLNTQAEKARYDNHENTEHSEGYKKFVSPIVQEVLANFNKDSHGLDFGSGPLSVIVAMLNEQDFNCDSYDLFYKNEPSLLEKKYDYITSCEVIEHFRNPKKEFEMLKNILNPNGKLICKTAPYDSSIDFGAWYYKNDPTHISIFQNKTFEWIAKNIGFSSVTIKERVIIFSK